MRFLFVCTIVLVVANFLIYRSLFAPHILKVSTLEVGKGQATLIQTPHRKTILIDTGPDVSILRALGTALPPWQRTIDLVILTSNKKSATGGLPDVVSRYKVLQQLTLTTSQRLSFGNNSYVDIVLTPNATTSISVFDGKTVTKIIQ